MSVSLEWDAKTYDRISDPQTRWRSAVVKRLRLAGNERVLDAGCGPGRVTEMLFERLSRGEVVALDASLEVLAEARRRLASCQGRVEFVLGDLREPLPLPLLLVARVPNSQGGITEPRSIRSPFRSSSPCRQPRR